ncbi:hypothetical protein Tco_0247197 [Tanacetum coccineum]
MELARILCNEKTVQRYPQQVTKEELGDHGDYDFYVNFRGITTCNALADLGKVKKRQKEAKSVKKPTKKWKRQDKSKEIAKDQSRISPIQQEKKANESQRTNDDKFSTFKGSFGCLKFKGPKLLK